MIEPASTNRIPVPAPGGSPACDGSCDRRNLLHLVHHLLACLDRIRSGGPLPSIPPDSPLHCWEDGDYVYLETRVAGDARGWEIDLNTCDGLVFVRISR
jgi:hypothetical protein